MTTIRTIYYFGSFLILLTGCTDSTVILKGHNFGSGDWFLVNKDHAKRTYKIIDDEKVLANNPNGIKVNWSEEHGGTTCDGILKLYKDGELIAQQEYLQESYITESSEIKAAYKNGSDESVYPYNNDDFQRQWDSLKQIKNCYPTRYHAQPAGKDIIWFYKYE